MTMPSATSPIFGAETTQPKVKVVLFGGGRGGSSIATALVSHPQIHLTVLVNTYDDGLSTGRLRQFIPGMLGPSDVRKNMSTLSGSGQRYHAALKTLLDYRLPEGTGRPAALSSLGLLAAGDRAPEAGALMAAYDGLVVRQATTISRYCKVFLAYEAEQFAAGRVFDFGDCSIGNILFAGCFLACGRDFNQTVKEFAAFSESRGTVLNVTDGQNFVLTAVTKDERFLRNEVAIVSPQRDTSVEEIFLLPDYLSQEEAERVDAMTHAQKVAFLRGRHCTPRPNPEGIAALRAADLIIYGPGTQNSSLLPSYLTDGVAEAIVQNTAAEKVFVSNILYDHDIQGRAVEEILNSFMHNMSRKGALTLDPDKVLTSIFVQSPDAADVNRSVSIGHLPYDMASLTPRRVKAGDWEEGGGRHAGGQIVDEMLSVVQGLVNIKIAPYRHTISIVVPALDEERTIGKVLDALEHLDVSHLNLNKEIILVDGGSKDQTVQIAKQHRVRVYPLTDKRGRGEALKLGISKARGNVIVVFPSDDEYDAADILKLAEPIVKNQFGVVFGSRMIKCVDLGKRIRTVYGEHNQLGYLVSKYGGMLFSVLSLLLYNRFISDPFSTIKAFDGSVLKNMRLNASGVDLEAELVAKLSKRRIFILEVPVRYRPRTRAQGKKTRMLDGVKTLFALLAWAFRSDDSPVAPALEATWDEGAPSRTQGDAR